MKSSSPIFGKLALDDKVSDCPYQTGFPIRPLLEHFGKDATWRDILKADRAVMHDIPGYAGTTIVKLYAFTSEFVDYTFMDIL
ncbi:MAG: hypothetical protein IJ584_17490 [Bacteroidales bacterium]|nr:hypothetical protein [Bacteroidales bacterium]MBR1436890.1 hypothetical protein [Bacteroidales bacterium]